ncbi:hypothetical protein [Rhodocista pekingensis]|uniref:Uncharacterized protein n=1 Tax=Rhodocista pekingensis TaxID=201185 RepID=A0ABW2KY19_9PROT
MSWKAIAITLMALLVLAVIGAAGLVVQAQRSAETPSELERAMERRSVIRDSIWRDFDKPYRSPSGEVQPNPFIKRDADPDSPRPDQQPTPE